MQKYLKKIPIISLNLTLIIFLTAFISENSDLKFYDSNLQIINQQNGKIHNFKTKIADSESERIQGLMFVKHLPENYAMFFKFEKTQQIYMWMKNTKIPLDMIFIDQEGKVAHIEQNAKPESLDIISSVYPVLKVLEINGGLTKELGIKAGDLVRY